MKQFTFIIAALFLLHSSFAQVKPAPQAKPKTSTTPKAAIAKNRLVQVTTDYGTMIIKLYDSTPNHRDNFIKLVKEGTTIACYFIELLKAS